MQTGVERFAEDFRAKMQSIDFRERYDPYPKQRKFHASTAPYNFLGGAAGPGKTACGIVEHMVACNEFPLDLAPQVHTLMLRRTQPKLEATLITRFQELVPQELYRSFKRGSPATVTWLNGSTTVFRSMQHEHNVWDMQGQWWKIFYDELCEFTFNQWNNISAWNRCPVDPYATKDGAGNPIGVGAFWVRKLFVDKKPADEMDAQQKKLYDPSKYAYFPCTYLDNPIFANDPQFLENLQKYPEAIRLALMEGRWDVVGGYFQGAFDSAANVCLASDIRIEPHHRRWISGDWGFEHFAAIYWHYMDDLGIVRTYKEQMVQHHDPEMLAELIIRESADEDGKFPKFVSFPFSHDAFADQTTKSYGANPNSVASRMSKVLRPYGLPVPMNAGKDKLGREQTMYNMLRRRVSVGEGPEGQPMALPNWIISEDCPRLIECLGMAPRDERPGRSEYIAEFLGDDPLQGAGYGIQRILGEPGKKSHDQQVREQLEHADEREKHWILLRETQRRQAKAEPKLWWD